MCTPACSQSPRVDHHPDGKVSLIVKTSHVVCTAEVGHDFKSRLVGLDYYLKHILHDSANNCTISLAAYVSR